MNRIGISDRVVEDDRRPGHLVNAGGWPAPGVDSIRTVDGNTILMRGNDAGTEFAAAVRVVCDGQLENPVSQLLVRNSSDVVMYIASSTSNRSQEPVKEVIRCLDAAVRKGYDALREEHIADFSALMDRCALIWAHRRRSLLTRDWTSSGMEPMIRRWRRCISSSDDTVGLWRREGSSALNLQGIWNAEFKPMWDSKYTININLQMNYWPVLAGNLPELHMPLMELLKKMHERGRETARVMYGMRGMVCHHNTDYYGDCAPQDWYMAAMPWVTGSAWLGLHVWEHYLYTKDLSVLQRMYPILRDMALFYEDFLIEATGSW
jgi:alpha-L-fucosidase 2